MEFPPETGLVVLAGEHGKKSKSRQNMRALCMTKQLEISDFKKTKNSGLVESEKTKKKKN